MRNENNSKHNQTTINHHQPPPQTQQECTLDARVAASILDDPTSGIREHAASHPLLQSIVDAYECADGWLEIGGFSNRREKYPFLGGRYTLELDQTEVCARRWW